MQLTRIAATSHLGRNLWRWKVTLLAAKSQSFACTKSENIITAVVYNLTAENFHQIIQLNPRTSKMEAIQYNTMQWKICTQKLTNRLSV